MSRMQECKDLFLHIQEAWERKLKTVLVILVRVEGSAYRLPGTKLVITSGGDIFGSISGGCLESDIYERGRIVFDHPEMLRHEYDLSETDLWGLGIGCNGKLEIAYLPVLENEPFWYDFMQLIITEEPCTLMVNLDEGRPLAISKSGFVYGESGMEENKLIEYGKNQLKRQKRAEILLFNEQHYYIDAIRPSARLIIAGKGKDAAPVIELAKRAGFSVHVLDVHKLSETAELGAYWIIMNHQQEHDEHCLELALNSHAAYIGVLGPLHRTETMLQNINKLHEIDRLHAPVGLDIGAETMDEVAISIVAELLTMRSGKAGTSLTGKRKIHA
ncbi:XdhC family protein [Pradoshia sp.]